MKFYEEYSHKFGKNVIEDEGLYDEIVKALNIPSVGACRGIAPTYKKEVEMNFLKYGWVINPEVDKNFNLTINAMKKNVGLMVQTGNITRAFYDLLKFQAMFLNNKINSCVLVVPTKDAARALGSNVANFTRVRNEIDLYKHIINMPCLIIGIDE